MEKLNKLESEAKLAKANLKFGQISLEEAKEMAQPYLDLVNNKSKELAKKFGVKPRLVNINSFLR